MLALACAKLSTFLYGFTPVGREPQAHRFLSFSRSLSPLPPSVSTSALRQLHDLVVVLLERGAVADGDEGHAPLAPAPAQQLRAAYNVGFLDHAYALCAQDASLAATIITSRQFIHVAAAAYRGGAVAAATPRSLSPTTMTGSPPTSLLTAILRCCSGDRRQLQERSAASGPSHLH